jgi:fructose 1,6-bisphosphatase
MRRELLYCHWKRTPRVWKALFSTLREPSVTSFPHPQLTLQQYAGSAEFDITLYTVGHAKGPRLSSSFGGAFDETGNIVRCIGFQLADGKLIGPLDMFNDPSYDESRRDATS